MQNSNFKETQFGLLPPDWKVATLNEVFDELDNRVKDFEDADASSFDVLSLTKNEGLILQSERFKKRIATEDVSNYKVVQRGQIVYNPYVIWEGAIHALREFDFGLVSPAYPILAAKEGVADPYYLEDLLRTPLAISAYNRFASGAVNRRRAISRRDFRTIEIPLPPLHEQRAIAHVLTTVRQAIGATERVIEVARELKRSMMKYLFTYGPVPVDQADQVPLKESEFGEVPINWKIEPLKQCANVQTGTAKGRKLGNAPTILVPYLRVANVQDGYLDLSEIKYIRIKQSELDRYMLQDGDVVLTEGGDFDKLGRGFIWQNQISNCIHQNHIFAVRANREVKS